MPNIGTLTAQLTLDSSRMRKGLVQSKAQLGQFVKGANTGIGTVTSSVVKLGGALIAMGGAFAAFRLFKDITNIGKEFEQTMTTAGAVMRATTEEMANLTAMAKQMGETTEFTASQAGGALKFLGMAGFDAAKAIAALPGVLDLATAGELELERAADIASNALTAMRLDVDQLGRVNDVFVGTITRSNTNMNQLAEAFKYSAPLAAAYGYEVEELAGLIGTLGNAGVQGSMAGTQLAQAFLEAKEIAKEFSFESGDLIDVLDSLKTKFGDNVDMMDHFTKRSGRAALVLSDAGDKVREFQQTLEGVTGEAKTLADAMRSTFGGMEKELISVMESIKIDAFELYKESLKSTMRDTIGWLRDNKAEILAWVNVVIKGFQEVWGAVGILLSIIGSVVAGIREVYLALQLESKETKEQLIKDGEDIRDAFAVPDFTLWQHLFDSLENAGNAVVEVFKLIGKALGSLVVGLLTFIVNDLLKNALEALWEFAGALAAFTVGDISGGIDKLKSAWNELTDIVKEGDQTGEAVWKTWAQAWDDMVGGIDFRSLKDKAIDALFDAALPKFTQDTGVMFGPALPPIDPTKPVLGDDTKQLETAANKKMDALKKIAKQWKVYFSHEASMESILLDVRVAILADLLGAEVKSKEDKLALWEDYRATRIEQMRAEHKALLDAGMDVALITDLVTANMGRLNGEQRDLFTEQASWLQEWAAELSEEMNYIFSDMFFDTMKGEWQGLTEYMTGIWDIFLRKIADSAADELSDIFSGGEGGGLLGKLFGGGDKIPALAAGGIINRPTLAVIGEAGPEAVIPLSKMRDEDFLNNFGGGGGSGGNVTIHVQTPDVASFQRSQQQIITQMSAALRQAGMRNG